MRQHWRRDLTLGVTALLAALLALPLAPRGGSPEITAALAVAAVALLAGHRWAVPMVVIGELLLWPDLLHRALAPPLDANVAQLAALGAAIAIVPGLFLIRRAAAGLVVGLGGRRGLARVRLAQLALVGCGAAGVFLVS